MHPPFKEGLDGSNGGAAGCDYGIEEDGEGRDGLGGREIVVIFNWSKGVGVAEEA